MESWIVRNRKTKKNHQVLVDRTDRGTRWRGRVSSAVRADFKISKIPRISSRYAKSLLAFGREATQMSFSPSKLIFEASKLHGSHQGSSLQVLIVILTAELRQISDGRSSRAVFYQRFPYLRLDDTPSSSSGSDSDPSEVYVAASQTDPPPPSPVLPPPPVPATPPLPVSPVSSRHSQLPVEDVPADRRQSVFPPRIPVWDGLRRMRGQARKTTGLPPRRQMAPRDEPPTIHEMGESSHQAEWRAQLQQVTHDLQGMRRDIQQQSARIDDTRSTVLEILTSHLTIIDRVNTLEADTQEWRISVEERLRRTWVQRIIAIFWQQVELLRAGAMRVRESLIWLGMASFETKIIVLGVIMAAVAMVFSCLSYFLR
ncbi:hypothetical protein E3N88_12903 [Mikania micrantha]|uniref:Uncharacterized protein n=1 Tax=Mikania micrantha TaxID=192012 RepID=A0A5N6P8U5_9ASTR|nr:hypothetical protein E3N88_12903 [Mikania micrantha]